MKNSSYSKSIFGILFLIFNSPAVADVNYDWGVGEKIMNGYTGSINKSIQAAEVPDANGWISLGELKLPTYSTHPTLRCGGYNLCLYAAAKVNAGVGAYHEININSSSQTRVINNKEFVFSGYFDGAPQMNLFEQNQAGGGGNYTHQVIVNKYGNVPDSSTSFSYQVEPQRGCGIGITGCLFSGTLYFTTVKLKLAVKLPANLQSGDYTFTDVPLFTISQRTHNKNDTNSAGGAVTVAVSGTITLPNRCYVSGSGISPELNFGAVKASYSEKTNITTKNINVPITCMGIQSKVKYSIQVDDGTPGFIKEFGSGAFGFAMKIVKEGLSGEPDCNANSGEFNKFGVLHEIRDIEPGAIFAATDSIKFSLCKLKNGYESQDIKDHKIPIKITTQWDG